MSPIRPREVECALKKCLSSSAAGNDNITYFHQRNYPVVIYSWPPYTPRFYYTCTLLPSVGAKAKLYYFIRKGTQPLPKTSIPLH